MQSFSEGRTVLSGALGLLLRIEGLGLLGGRCRGILGRGGRIGVLGRIGLLRGLHGLLGHAIWHWILLDRRGHRLGLAFAVDAVGKLGEQGEAGLAVLAHTDDAQDGEHDSRQIDQYKCDGGYNGQESRDIWYMNHIDKANRLIEEKHHGGSHPEGSAVRPIRPAQGIWRP